jgi:hypothetical protein
MTVTLRSEAFGKLPGETYTGPEEAWLLAEGYAYQAGYTGPGVSETGPADVVPANDPTLAVNREDPPGWAGFGEDPDYDEGPLDPAIAENDPGYDPDVDSPADKYDFDPNATDNDPSSFAPASANVTPATGVAAGGLAVVVRGEGFERATGVTFGGTAGTAFSVIDDEEIHVTTPAHAAGAVDVVVVDPNGNATATGGFTYTA